MQDIKWSEDMALGVPAMDAAHHALLDQFARLEAMPDEQLGEAFLALVATVERDFREEEDMMEQIGYPGLHTHREQHARVLSGLHHAEPVAGGADLRPVREALALLPQWFLLHQSTMDMALAAALDVAAQADEPGARAGQELRP